MEVTAPETRGVDATMVATQSRGYVELFLALGRALVAAGHRPREQRHSGSALREPEPTGYPRAPCGMSVHSSGLNGCLAILVLGDRQGEEGAGDYRFPEGLRC